ncbi:MAG: DUF6491 family protein [Azospirillaceae bacterium]|nr:DUF6491 family protein [Azospirillaceae bacterium]
MSRPLALAAFLATALLAGCAAQPDQAAGPDGTAVASAQPTKEDRGPLCISMRDIKDTKVINDRTILVTLRERGKFLRVDLTDRCVGLGFYGFAHVSYNDEFCRTDPLTLVGMPVSPTCLIDRMMPIDKEAADALIAAQKADKHKGSDADKGTGTPN